MLVWILRPTKCSITSVMHICVINEAVIPTDFHVVLLWISSSSFACVHPLMMIFFLTSNFENHWNLSLHRDRQFQFTPNNKRNLHAKYAFLRLEKFSWKIDTLHINKNIIELLYGNLIFKDLKILNKFYRFKSSNSIFHKGQNRNQIPQMLHSSLSMRKLLRFDGA